MFDKFISNLGGMVGQYDPTTKQGTQGLFAQGALINAANDIMGNRTDQTNAILAAYGKPTIQKQGMGNLALDASRLDLAQQAQQEALEAKRVADLRYNTPSQDYTNYAQNLQDALARTYEINKLIYGR